MAVVREELVEVREKSRSQTRVAESLSIAAQAGLPDWVDVDEKALKGTFKALPARADLSSTINESLIIELYSK